MTVSRQRGRSTPWAIARRFAHKTTSYGYLKTYWPAHALRFGGSDWAEGEGKGGKKSVTQPSDKSKDIKTIPAPLSPFAREVDGEPLHLLRSSLLAREFFLAKRITGVAEGRHKTIHVHGHGLRAAPLVGCFTFRSATRNREQFNRP